MNTIVLLILSAVIAFGISALLGIKLVPWLHKLKFGQTILDIGPSWHKNKQGTPTMGGLMFIISTILTFLIAVIIASATGVDLYNVVDSIIPSDSAKIRIIAGILMALGFGIIGFLDDFIKVKKAQNEGLTVLQKTLLQLVLCGAYIATLAISGNRFMVIPFVGTWDYGNVFVFAIFTFIVMYAAVNAVNFTDGIDGLCASVTVTAGLGFAATAFVMHQFGASLLACILVGACAGYLIWNWHPAKCFMGDTGSMFLGGMVVALAYAINCPLILLLIGLIYVVEGASDVIQILYFKITKKLAQRTDPEATGKRLFKMAPIHHHFEKCGWKEEKICIVFCAVNLIASIIAVLLVKFGF